MLSYSKEMELWSHIMNDVLFAFGNHGFVMRLCTNAFVVVSVGSTAAMVMGSSPASRTSALNMLKSPDPVLDDVRQ